MQDNEGARVSCEKDVAPARQVMDEAMVGRGHVFFLNSASSIACDAVLVSRIMVNLKLPCRLCRRGKAQAAC